MKVLIIEDDVKVAEYIKSGLFEEGHAAVVAFNGKDGLSRAMTEKYDVLIIDRMLPEIEGLTIIKTLRASGNATPVLILSALGEVDDKVKGLRSGGDDYLVKPFSFSELLARVEVLSRRGMQPAAAAETRLSAQGLEMDLLTRKVMRDGKSVDIHPREFRLLEYILRHKGQVVTRAMLLENVWDYHFDPQTNVIDVHISRLRAKVDRNSETPIIKTVRGAGYIIEE
jgi:two-component system OmpR family response regulator